MIETEGREIYYGKAVFIISEIMQNQSSKPGVLGKLVMSLIVKRKFKGYGEVHFNSCWISSEVTVAAKSL